MSDTSKATPRPWFVRRYSGELTIQGRRGTATVGIFIPCQLVDAQFIVAAANSYNPERDWLAQKLAQDCELVFTKRDGSIRWNLRDFEAERVRKQARQLLKLCEEEKP